MFVKVNKYVIKMNLRSETYHLISTLFISIELNEMEGYQRLPLPRDPRSSCSNGVSIVSRRFYVDVCSSYFHRISTVSTIVN